MSDDNKEGWFTNLVNGFFSLMSVGHEKTDFLVKTTCKILFLFLVLSVLLFATFSALGDWFSLLSLDTAASAVGDAFSKAVEQSVNETAVPASTDLPLPD